MSNNTNIRKMTEQDKQAVIEMMRVFYTSPAVFSNGSENIFLQDVEACTGDNPYLDGYIFAAPDSVEQDKQCETCHIFFGQLDG